MNFSYYITNNNNLGKLKFLDASDINSDGFNDIVLVNNYPWINGSYTSTTSIFVAFNQNNNSFNVQKLDLTNSNDNKFFDPYILVNDFNGDGLNDIIIYDAGFYDWNQHVTRGKEPILYLANANGTFVRTNNLSSLYQARANSKIDNLYPRETTVVKLATRKEG